MRTGVMRVVCLLLLWGGVLGLSDDGVALLAVKRSVTWDPLQVLASWDERDADPCAWCGVTCGPGRRVVALNLPGRVGVSRFQCDGAAVVPPGWSCAVESRRICFRNGTVSDRGSGDGEVVPCVLYGTLAREIGNLTELVDLSLPFNGFSGEVPEEIGSLTRLETLDLEANSFSGAVPVEIGQLPRLRVLNLASNAFQGGIPPQAPSLCFLSLAGNTLRGSIPPSVGALQWLSLSSNLLDGEIPVFGTCEYLVYLDLSNNYFTGPIPAELANCTQLESLFLNSNSLVGSIPPDFGRLGKLQHLHLALNELSGPLPSALGQCTHLSTLVLSASQGCSYGLNSFVEVHRREGNRFSGGFPSELAVLPSLQVIWGPECGLSGALPAKWGTSLEILNLAKNFFTGGIPGGLGVCKSLVVLDLSENQLSGRIPGELPISCLVILNVSSNALFGSISAAETECTNPWLLSLSGDSFFRPLTCYGVPGLNYVSRRDADVIYVVHDFSSNILSGPVPVSLVGSTLMKKHTAYVLTLANNQLNGSFPDRFFSFCRGFQEFAVNLSYNRLLGELPLEVGECDTMWYLDVAGNQLTGSIPESTGALSHLVILNLSRNRLRGGIPWQLGELSHLEGLFLDNNLFSGSMPSSLGNMSSLVMLDLSYNSLSGTIPKELGNLSQLKSLLLNHNRLSGSIPKDLSRLTSLEQLNFSFNNLSGQFPILGNWGGLCSSLVVMGNPYLLPCRVATAPQSVPILADPDGGHDMSPDSNMSPNPRRRDPSPRFNSIVVAAITSGCAIGVVLLILGLLFQCTKQQYPSLQTGSEGRKVVVTFTNINFHLTYDKLVRATQNFCLDNLIGTGGFGATYKAELRPGLVVAVKRLAIGRFQGVQQFDTEIRTLGRIRHPNLVTLIGYHASEEEMFLIYNYFPEGNLDTLIHISDGGKQMNWSMRYKIALDLARALAYLHDECVPRVLHRDIKPSNVLLDQNLSAHLSDFGLARLLGDTETHATTDVAGTFGYVAPEYAMTCRLSDKADVYSYGVVLLELLSGKRVLDPTFSNYGNGFNIVGWATLLIHNHRPQEVFSAGLWQAGPEKDLLNVLYLAVECTEESMSVRPPMRQVVERLRSCYPHPPPPLPLPL